MTYLETKFGKGGPDFTIKLKGRHKSDLSSKKVRDFIDSIFKYISFCAVTTFFISALYRSSNLLLIPFVIILFFLSYLYARSLGESTYIHLSDKNDTFNIISNYVFNAIYYAVIPILTISIVTLMLNHGTTSK